MKKAKKFKTDEWALYCQFPDSKHDMLRMERKRVVILEVLKKDDFYDYRIFIDDGTSKITKVKEENLFPITK